MNKTLKRILGVSKQTSPPSDPTLGIPTKTGRFTVIGADLPPKHECLTPFALPDGTTDIPAGTKWVCECSNVWTMEYNHPSLALTSNAYRNKSWFPAKTK